MKFIKYFTLFSMFLCGASFADNNTQSNESVVLASTNTTQINKMNGIVAYVNKRIITRNELNAQIKTYQQNLKSQGISVSDSRALESQVLDQMITQQIQLDMATRGGIKTTDAEINQTIANIEKSQNVTDAQMQAKLASQGTSMSQFRQQIAEQITLQKLKQREVDGRVFVNDDEVNRVINSEAYKNRIDYKLSTIMVGIPEQATQQVVAEKEALANKAYAELQHGVPFEKVVLQYSTAPNALNGGDIGWKSNTSLPPNVVAQLKDLKSGQFTNVVKFPIGFMIFKINDIRQHGSPQIVRQYEVRHILVKVNELVSDNEAHQKIDKIYDDLAQYKNDPVKESEVFAALAKQYSDDPGSAIKGGALGWSSKGEMVPQFEHVMTTTPVGQVSKPFRSAFGWHILEVTGVRDSNMANEKERSEIRNEIRESKSQVQYTEWLRNLRETAYVKVND